MVNIYSAKFMNEATATLADKVLKKPVQETYLYTAIRALSEMNSVINTNTKNLYIGISEAESKAGENKLFAEYYYQFKKVFEDFVNRIEEMKSRMIISVENKVETWNDLIKDDSYISSFEDEFKYQGYEFHHIEDANYPRLNLMKFYQKEFDYLGQLMQDAGIGASPTAKMKIIATVSNNFTSSSGDKHWLKNMLKDMIDIDDDDDCKSYSECIYRSLREKEDIKVDKGYLYTCKENLSDYNDAIDAAVKLCNALIMEVNRVADDISSYIFRNKDNKLRIKTDTDGVIDRDYRLDTYSMNQLDIFMRSKVNQVKKILNIYTIAIGIKFDTVVDYITQNINILNTVKNANISDTVEEPSDNEPLEDNTEDNTQTQEPEEVPDEDKEPIEEEEPSDDYDFELNKGEFDEDLDTEVHDGNGDEDGDGIKDKDEIEDVENNEFEESYLFESELFELQLMYESYDLQRDIKEALMLEDGEEGGDKPAAEEKKDDKPSTGLDNTKDMVDKNAKKPNLWQRFVQKLAELWKKFREFAIERTKEKVEYLKKNEKYIKMKINDECTLAYTPKYNELKAIKIPDLNYNGMKDKLKDEKSFISTYFSKYNKGDKSLSDTMKEELLGEKQENIKANSKISEAYDFCIKYPENINLIKTQTDIIQKAEKNALNIAKSLSESVNNNDYKQYFMEFDAKPGDVSEKTKGIQNELNVYFKVCSQVLAAEMTIYQKIFNEMYAFCKWYIKQAGGNGGSEEGSKEGENNNSQQQAQTTNFDN